MNTFLKTIFVSVFLAGCAPSVWAPVPGDYVLHVRPPVDIQMEYEKRGGAKPIRAFAVTSKDPCEIWVSPEDVTAYVLEHELRHCREPEWEH